MYLQGSRVELLPPTPFLTIRHKTYCGLLCMLACVIPYCTLYLQGSRVELLPSTPFPHYEALARAGPRSTLARTLISIIVILMIYLQGSRVELLPSTCKVEILTVKLTSHYLPLL